MTTTSNNLAFIHGALLQPALIIKASPKIQLTSIAGVMIKRSRRRSIILNVSVSWFFEDVEALLAPSRAAGFGEAEQEPLDVDPNAQAEAPPLEETRKLIRAWGRIRDARQRKKILELICSLSEDDA